MPIIEKKTVTFFTDAIPGIDSIWYIDACFQSPFMPFDTGWEVHEVDAFNALDPRFDTLTSEQQELVWKLAEQHQVKQHEHGD